jgi:hypothetical protein
MQVSSKGDSYRVGIEQDEENLREIVTSLTYEKFNQGEYVFHFGNNTFLHSDEIFRELRRQVLYNPRGYSRSTNAKIEKSI